jgi:prepilin peptidase CpaA
MPVVIAVSAVAFVGLCIALDVRTRRIPNVVTVPAIVLGLAVNGLYMGPHGVATSLAGLVLPVALLLFPFALGGIGGGDVKMMAAVGALLGPRLAVWGLVLGMILGGGIMLAHLGRIGRLREKLRATASMVSAAVATGSVAPLRPTGDPQEIVALPYSVPLGLGTLAVLAFCQVTGGAR